MTYDGEHLFIQADCLYTLVENLNPTDTLPPFVVNVKFEYRDGNTVASWPQFIHLFVYGLDIVIDREKVVRVSYIRYKIRLLFFNIFSHRHKQRSLKTYLI